MTMKRALIVAVVMFLTACAAPGNIRPLIDSHGVDLSRYEADLAQCNQYAAQVLGAGERAVIGALVGAGLSALLSGMTGNRNMAGPAARGGALLGAIGGGADGAQSQHQVVTRCLAGRGYRVLQ